MKLIVFILLPFFIFAQGCKVTYLAGDQITVDFEVSCNPSHRFVVFLDTNTYVVPRYFKVDQDTLGVWVAQFDASETEGDHRKKLRLIIKDHTEVDLSCKTELTGHYTRTTIVDKKLLTKL